jgi:hypothetical protein
MAHLGPIEHGWLVHVVPDVQVLGGARVAAWVEVGGPPCAHLWAEHVQIGAGPWPAPPETDMVWTCYDIILAHNQGGGITL